MNRKTNALRHRNRYAKQINKIIPLYKKARSRTLPEQCAEDMLNISLIAQEIAADIKQKYMEV